MKTTHALIAIAIMSAAPGILSPARAVMRDGFFSGRGIKSRIGTNVFIKTVLEKVAIPAETPEQRPVIITTTTAYGLMVRADQTASLYRIEELADGTQAWVELFQTSDNLLASDDNQSATFSGQIVRRDGDTYLTLSPTDFGEKLGCTEIIEAKASDRQRWAEFPKGSGRLDSRKSGVVDYVPGRLTNARIDLDGATLTGEYTLESLFDGAALVRSQTLDAEAESGRSLKKEFAAVAVVIRHKNRKALFFNDDFTQFRLIHLRPGVASCQMPSSQVNND